MEYIKSINQIQNLIAEIRNRRKGYLTNFYLDSFKHQVWIENRDLQFEIVNDTLFLIRSSSDFCNMFYCTTNIEELLSSLFVFNQKNSDLFPFIDVVGSEEQCRPIIDEFEKNGYSEYKMLARMSRITPSGNNDLFDTHVEFASIEDSRKVKRLLLEFFDERCEQIPYQEELDEYVKNDRILVYKQHGEILGFVIFESNRATHYLRYWFVHPKHREKKVGSALLKSFFHIGQNTKRQLFWVITDNENAIKRYEHYGFQFENMKDYVLTKNIVGGKFLILRRLPFHNYQIAA